LGNFSKQPRSTLSHTLNATCTYYIIVLKDTRVLMDTFILKGKREVARFIASWIFQSLA